MKRLIFLCALPLTVFYAGCITIQTVPAAPATPYGGLPVIEEFSCTPSDIDYGGTSKLLWNISGADSVSIDQGIGMVAAAGTMEVSPPASALYTIMATNSVGSVTASAFISVSAAPQAPLPQTANGGQKSVTLPVLIQESGSIIKSTSLSTGSATYVVDKEHTCLGDKSGGAQVKAFFSFDISAIPQSAVIETAILDMSDCTISGNPIYAESFGGMGAVKVYHHQYGDIEDTMNHTMIWSNRLAKLTQNGSFSEYPLSPWAWDVKNADSGAPVIQELVGMGQARSQFMLEFFTSTNWDYVTDTLCFSNVTLTVKYTVY